MTFLGGVALILGLHGAAGSRPEPTAAAERSILAALPEGMEVPSGMVFVPGGETHIGSEDGNDDESPVFRARVPAFFMDAHPVTVSQFHRFVDATGYVTDAERIGDAAVFDAGAARWHLVSGASWRQPTGPDAPPALADHPVTQVSWNDATAYAVWAGNRLPTEVEWEHAARGARDRRDRYAWGDVLVVGGRYRANTWNGHFPAHDSGADGYPASTSPVGEFGETELGLTDLGGNVWEWSADWYRPYSERSRPFAPTATSERAQRGGSFLCSPDFCHGFRVSARSHSTPDSALGNVGFRTVRDLPGDRTGP